eukprot:354821-Chlamydomonas_euryale.AAC.1
MERIVHVSARSPSPHRDPASAPPSPLLVGSGSLVERRTGALPGRCCCCRCRCCCDARSACSGPESRRPAARSPRCGDTAPGAAGAATTVHVGSAAAASRSASVAPLPSALAPALAWPPPGPAAGACGALPGTPAAVGAAAAPAPTLFRAAAAAARSAAAAVAAWRAVADKSSSTACAQMGACKLVLLKHGV